MRMSYFITFACLGAHLYGDQSGAGDRRRNRFGASVLGRRRMDQPPSQLDPQSGAVVLETLRQVCWRRGWGLLAARVRTSHVYVILEAEDSPEKVMNDLKTYASRALNRVDGAGSGRKRWARHGSTRCLWKNQDVREAIRYVVEEQGEPVAAFLGRL